MFGFFYGDSADQDGLSAFVKVLYFFDDRIEFLFLGFIDEIGVILTSPWANSSE